MRDYTIKLDELHVNELSELLNKSGIGGNLGGTIRNHMLYADIICIVSLQWQIQGGPPRNA